MGYNNILVTLDGSVLAEEALKHVTSLAETGAVIHVLSVVTHDPAHIAMSVAHSSAYLRSGVDFEMLATLDQRNAENMATLMQYQRNYLRRVTADLVEAGYNVTLDVRRGDVIKTIIDTASKGYDVIVMATHGRTGFSKALLGSVAETVLHQAPCPVLLIPVHSTVLANQYVT